MPDDVQPILSNNVKELLEKAKPGLLAIPADQIVRRTITPDRVLSLTKVMHASWQELQDVLDQELHEHKAKLRKDQIASLRGFARVFYVAELIARDLTANTNKISADELAITVKRFDRQLYKWADPLFGDDPIKAATLRDIARGRGKRDDANDVLRLTKMFRDNWSSAKGKTEITEELLDQAEAAAQQQLELLSGELPNAAKDLSARAYTVWYQCYVQLRRLAFYLFGHLPDAAQRFPGLGTPSTRRAADEKLPPTTIEDLQDDPEQADQQPQALAPDQDDLPDDELAFDDDDEEQANLP